MLDIDMHQSTYKQLPFITHYILNQFLSFPAYKLQIQQICEHHFFILSRTGRKRYHVKVSRLKSWPATSYYSWSLRDYSVVLVHKIVEKTSKSSGSSSRQFYRQFFHRPHLRLVDFFKSSCLYFIDYDSILLHEHISLTITQISCLLLNWQRIIDSF
jgi:hypothetical protein